MNTVSYKVAVGTHVWAINEPRTATERCKHCGEWTNWKPDYKIDEVIVGGVHVWVDKNTTSVSYNLLYDNNFTHYKDSAKVGEDFYLTKEAAEEAVRVKQAEWNKNHGR